MGYHLGCRFGTRLWVGVWGGCWHDVGGIVSVGCIRYRCFGFRWLGCGFCLRDFVCVVVELSLIVWVGLCCLVWALGFYDSVLF